MYGHTLSDVAFLEPELAEGIPDVKLTLNSLPINVPSAPPRGCLHTLNRALFLLLGLRNPSARAQAAAALSRAGRLWHHHLHCCSRSNTKAGGGCGVQCSGSLFLSLMVWQPSVLALEWTMGKGRGSGQGGWSCWSVGQGYSPGITSKHCSFFEANVFSHDGVRSQQKSLPTFLWRNDFSVRWWPYLNREHLDYFLQTITLYNQTEREINSKAGVEVKYVIVSCRLFQKWDVLKLLLYYTLKCQEQLGNNYNFKQTTPFPMLESI